jgi:signal transduction histidine kinase
MTNEVQIHQPLCILHLEDSVHDHVLAKREFEKSEEAVEMRRVENLDDFEQALNEARFNVVLADFRLPGFTAMDAWQLMQVKKVRLPFILLSGAIGESAAVAAIKSGISDYLPKDDLSKLRHITQRAIEMHQLLLAKELADIELAQSEKRLARFAEHLQVTIEQERASIAREIHDDIGGSLAAIRFDLSWVNRHTSDNTIRSHISAATEMLQHAVEASQRIMMNLRPAILDQGLIAAIHWLGNDFSKRTGIETSIRVPSQLQALPKTTQLVVYRTAQESLTNVSKYAQCTHVKIDLSGDEHFLTLEVADNGLGISDSDISKPHSFGIRGLKERAKTIDGWLDVSSLKGQGTSITLTVPLDKKKEDIQENLQNDSSDFV